MMKILAFDLFCSQPYANVKFHGGGEYVKTFFCDFINNYSGNDKILVFYDKNIFLDDYVIEKTKQNNVETIYVSSYEEIVLYLNNIHDAEIRFFAGLPFHYGKHVFNDNIFKIGVCHGLRDVEKFSDRYSLLYFSSFELMKQLVRKVLEKRLYKKYFNGYRNMINNLDVVITDSYHSKYSILLNFGKKDVDVFYPKTQSNSLNDNVKASDNNTIMLVSANRWIKNSYRAITALDNLFSKNLILDYKVSVFGDCPKRIKKRIRNINNFEFFKYVSSEELENAFASCSVFLYPTLNEGFGNVPMEAMKYGKTCVVSAVCSLPEVYSDSVYLVNPYDVMEIENRILQAVYNRISDEKISKRMEYLKKKQDDDFVKLFNLVTGCENE